MDDQSPNSSATAIPQQQSAATTDGDAPKPDTSIPESQKQKEANLIDKTIKDDKSCHYKSENQHSFNLSKLLLHTVQDTAIILGGTLGAVAQGAAMMSSNYGYGSGINPYRPTYTYIPYQSYYSPGIQTNQIIPIPVY